MPTAKSYPTARAAYHDARRWAKGAENDAARAACAFLYAVAATTRAGRDRNYRAGVAHAAGAVFDARRARRAVAGALADPAYAQKAAARADEAARYAYAAREAYRAARRARAAHAAAPAPARAAG